MMRIISTLLFCLGAVSLTAQEKEWTDQEIVNELCQCYEKEEGNETVGKWNQCFEEFLKAHDDVVGKKCSKFPAATMVSDCKTEMLTWTVKLCDSFSADMQRQYVRSFPQHRSDSLDKMIKGFAKKLRKSRSKDSTRVYLSQLVYLNIQSKYYDEALKYIDKLAASGANKAKAYEAEAYVHYMTGDIDKSLQSLDKAAQFSARNNYKVLAEVIKRKK